MNTLQQVTNKIILTVLTNDTVKEVAEAIALFEVEEAINKMFND